MSKHEREQARELIEAGRGLSDHFGLATGLLSRALAKLARVEAERDKARAAVKDEAEQTCIEIDLRNKAEAALAQERERAERLEAALQKMLDGHAGGAACHQIAREALAVSAAQPASEQPICRHGVALGVHCKQCVIQGFCDCPSCASEQP